jgi:hypothetical protein
VISYVNMFSTAVGYRVFRQGNTALIVAKYRD